MTTTQPNPKRRLCRVCLLKEPPIETELVPGVNISEARFKKSDFVDDDCKRLQRRQYNTGAKEKYADYNQNLHDETCDELTVQWEDPAYRKSRIADRVYKVLDKYGRRNPAKGIRKRWILEVIMRELWFIDLNAIVEDILNELNWTRSKRIAAKPVLLQALASRLEFLQEPYRRLAENRWDGIVDKVNQDHEGIDKLVATPPHEDPETKEMVKNWYLLSREQERVWREQMREERKGRADLITDQERIIVETREAEVARQKAENEPNKEPNDDSATNNTNGSTSDNDNNGSDGSDSQQ